MKNAFTVDVEDGISIAMRDAFGKPIKQTDRVVTNTVKILGMLAENSTKGTFFVLGQVAEVFPELIKDISDQGHELGVHGYDHWEFFKMNPEQAFDELDRAKKLIEDISGKRVFGHRAPAFSIMPDTAWGLDVIYEAGFEYDSSIMPCEFGRYGWANFKKDIDYMTTPKGNSIIEAPMSIGKIGSKQIPVCGGSYLRLLPISITDYFFDQVRKEKPVIAYMHPYEVDLEKYPDFYFEELAKVGLAKRMKMKSFWINRNTVYPKLEHLVKKYQFDTLINIINKNLAKEGVEL